jgi:hypothetical protein
MQSAAAQASRLEPADLGLWKAKGTTHLEARPARALGRPATNLRLGACAEQIVTKQSAPCPGSQRLPAPTSSPTSPRPSPRADWPRVIGCRRSAPSPRNGRCRAPSRTPPTATCKRVVSWQRRLAEARWWSGSSQPRPPPIRSRAPRAPRCAPARTARWPAAMGSRRASPTSRSSCPTRPASRSTSSAPRSSACCARAGASCSATATRPATTSCVACSWPGPAAPTPPPAPKTCSSPAVRSRRIDLVLRTFCAPGDAVVVPVPCYHQMFGLLARARPARCCRCRLARRRRRPRGARTRALHMPRARLLYVMPTFQNPTGRTLERGAASCADGGRRSHGSAGARRRLSASELRFAGEPQVSLRSLDGRGLTVTRATASARSCSPALRIGWVVGSPDLLRPMAAREAVHGPRDEPAAAGGARRVRAARQL